MCSYQVPRDRQWGVILLLAAVVAAPLPIEAASPEIEAALKRGADYLAEQVGKTSDGGYRTLIAYALYKAGRDASSPEVQETVNLVLDRFQDGEYRPSGQHIYLCAVDLSLLVDIDPEKYQGQAQAAADYLIASQLPNGGWDYPSGRNGHGDTSVTQYALLGLWTAYRAGAEIPMSTWDNALKWLTNTQLQNGAWTYVPGTTEGHAMGAPDLNMTMAALSALAIAARHAFPGRADSLQQLMSRGESPTVDKPKASEEDGDAGPLVAIDLSKPPEGAAMEAEDSKTSKFDIDKVRQSLNRGLGWAAPRYIVYPDKQHYYGDYYLYTVERTASLLDIDKIGAARWYDDAVPRLLQSQTNEGFWKLHAVDSRVERQTAFVLLFLARSTGKVLNRTKGPDPTHGGGLLTGGKGEPTEVVAAKKEPTPLDQLLKSLQNPGSLNLEQAQSELIEQVQLGDREELIGQKKTIVRLIQHPHGEIRRTAAWALGRTNDLHLARYLVDALEDDDLGVMMEAHAGLSWLSRRFDGFGLPTNPLNGLPENASDEEQQAAIRGWRTRARREWGNWYLRVRPYADRGDEFEAQLQQRLGDQ